MYPDLGIVATYFNEWCDVTVASQYRPDNGTYVQHSESELRRLSLLSVFAVLREATINFVMSVRMEQLFSHWTDFREI
jgi:hypothetical protein